MKKQAVGSQDLVLSEIHSRVNKKGCILNETLPQTVAFWTPCVSINNKEECQ